MPEAVALELSFSLSRFHQLRADYLRVCAQGRADTWSPGLSGGDHHPDWSAEAIALATKLLAAKPPASCSAGASVRRWAIAPRLNPDTRYKPTRQPVKRWQARDHGALWPYDAPAPKGQTHRLASRPGLLPHSTFVRTRFSNVDGYTTGRGFDLSWCEQNRTVVCEQNRNNARRLLPLDRGFITCPLLQRRIGLCGDAT